MRQTLRRLRPKLRRLIAKSWILSRCYYPLCGHRLPGRANDEIWYFAYGANMHDNAFRVRRGIQPLEHCSGRIRGYQLRFNLDGRPKGRAAPANLCPDPRAKVWGVLYRITRRGLLRLDSTEGVPGRGYRAPTVIGRKQPNLTNSGMPAAFACKQSGANLTFGGRVPSPSASDRVCGSTQIPAVIGHPVSGRLN
jgi:hypothetical protein